MAYAHKMFDVFERLNLAKAFEGVGAGLAIVKRIVSRHDGRVWAKEELGGGATFYIALPYVVLAPQDEPLAPEAQIAPARTNRPTNDSRL